MIEKALHLTLLILFPPLMLGFINKTKAVFAGRTGAPLLQPYYDIIKLFRKGLVVSSTTSWIFQAGPIVTLAAVLLTGCLIPFGPFNAPLSFTGDIILFVYLFGLARFFTTAAALDTGSAFEGMGSAREATFACLTEPALLFALMVPAKTAGSLKLNDLLHIQPGSYTSFTIAPLVLVSIGLFIILLAETCHIPVDDPNTHLELTMIHEAMVLDHSGPLLGMITYSAALKMFVFGSLLLHLAAPFTTGCFWADWLIFASELLALSAIVGTVESVMARLQMKRVPYLLTGALLLCGSGFILLVR